MTPWLLKGRERLQIKVTGVGGFAHILSRALTAGMACDFIINRKLFFTPFLTYHSEIRPPPPAGGGSRGGS